MTDTRAKTSEHALPWNLVVLRKISHARMPTTYALSILWLTLAWHGKGTDKWTWIYIVGYWTRGLVVGVFYREFSIAWWGDKFWRM